MAKTPLRRQHARRAFMKRARLSQWRWGYTREYALTHACKGVKTRTPCSCSMCSPGNWGYKSRSQIVQDAAFKQDMIDTSASDERIEKITGYIEECYRDAFVDGDEMEYAPLPTPIEQHIDLTQHTSEQP